VQYNNGINAARICTQSSRIQFEARLNWVLETCLAQCIFTSRMTVHVAISDIARCARKAGFPVRYTGIDGFLMLNVSNFYEHHCVRMQELEVRLSQHTYRIEPDAPEENSHHQLTLCAGHKLSTEYLNKNIHLCI